MSKMLCKCGETLFLQKIPNDKEYKFISDVEYDKYEGMIDSEKLYMEMKSFIKCNKCGRLWFFWDGFNNEPKEYLPSELKE